jgi:predicted nucleic acid-binding protein
MEEKCDKIVVKRGSKLMTKIWRISKESQNWEPQRRLLAKYFFNSFIKNSEKCEILEQGEIHPVPAELARLVSTDDVYLLQTALATKDKFILTTDNELHRALSSHSNIRIELVDDFLSKYLTSGK